ncbi:hypothetical protein M8494_13925 [Serratia ureilytica]
MIATFLFSVQPVIMAYLINAIEEKEFSLSLSIITLAISYIAIMSMRKLSSALNFILITSLRNNIVINMTDNYFKSLFNLKEINSHENTGDITQRLNQAIDELTILLRNISHNLLPSIPARIQHFNYFIIRRLPRIITILNLFYPLPSH